MMHPVAKVLTDLFPAALDLATEGLKLIAPKCEEPEVSMQEPAASTGYEALDLSDSYINSSSSSLHSSDDDNDRTEAMALGYKEYTFLGPDLSSSLSSVPSLSNASSQTSVFSDHNDRIQQIPPAPNGPELFGTEYKGMELSDIYTFVNWQKEPSQNSCKTSPSVVYPDNSTCSYSSIQDDVDSPSPSPSPSPKEGEYLPEILESFYEGELEEHSSTCSFLSQSNLSQIRPLRESILRQILALNASYQFSLHTLLLAVNITNRMFSSRLGGGHGRGRRGNMDILTRCYSPKVISLTIVFIASKYHEIDSLQSVAASLSYDIRASDGCLRKYKYEVVEFEAILLETLEWKLTVTTPLSFGECFLEMIKASYDFGEVLFDRMSEIFLFFC